MLRATTACTFSTSQLPKVVREWCALYILTSKCASRYNGVHFFNISTSKSGPRMVCFVHFDFKMCFALQRRALFQHLNFQKWSENGVLCTFYFQMCFAPQRRTCIFPTFSTVFRDFPTVSRTCIFFLLIFSLLTLLPADCFFISLLTAFSSLHIVGSLTSKLPSKK